MSGTVEASGRDVRCPASTGLHPASAACARRCVRSMRR
nr:MAG TPA_asm: hypothetical protein [Caudoviricetes sp.]